MRDFYFLDKIRGKGRSRNSHSYEGYEEQYLVKGCWKVGDMVIVEGSRKNWIKVLSWPQTWGSNLTSPDL